MTGAAWGLPSVGTALAAATVGTAFPGDTTGTAWDFAMAGTEAPDTLTSAIVGSYLAYKVLLSWNVARSGSTVSPCRASRSRFEYAEELSRILAGGMRQVMTRYPYSGRSTKLSSLTSKSSDVHSTSMPTVIL